jgi:hypothetical protein
MKEHRTNLKPGHSKETPGQRNSSVEEYNCASDPEGESGRGHRSPAVIGTEFFSMSELASRWRCSRGTVYNRLRAAGALVLDFAAPGARSRKVVALAVVLQLEKSKTKLLC